MCNACHNQCCGSDMFYACGCDGCDVSECWSDDDDDDDVFDYDDPAREAECAPRSRFTCTSMTAEDLAGLRQILADALNATE